MAFGKPTSARVATACRFKDDKETYINKLAKLNRNLILTSSI